MALEGSLQDMSLEDLFEIFEAGGRSGRLTLVQGTDHGVLLISQGQIAEAALLRGPEHQVVATNIEAVMQVCAWEAASFAFVHDISVADRPRRINASFAQLQEQARRRRALVARPLTLSDVLALVGRAEIVTPTITLSLDEWQLLSALGRNTSLAEVCLEAGMVPTLAMATAGGLAQRGLLRQIEVAQPPALGQPVAPSAELAPAPPVARKAAPARKRPPSLGPGGDAKVLLQAVIRKVRNL